MTDTADTASTTSAPGLAPGLLLVAVPVVGAILATALFVLAEVVGLRPLQHAPLTVSEAAAVGDGPALVRLLYTGHSPHARYAVGVDLLRPLVPGALMPIEAAVLGNQPAMVAVLERWGVPIDDSLRAHLVCLADRAAAGAAAEALTRGRPDAACADPAPH
jgi:hypothetical protein